MLALLKYTWMESDRKHGTRTAFSTLLSASNVKAINKSDYRIYDFSCKPPSVLSESVTGMALLCIVTSKTQDHENDYFLQRCLSPQ